MARISLLFTLAFVLGLGSLFLSVSGHAPLVQPLTPLFPETIYELETLPFTKITEFLSRKEKFAPKTAEFKAMFTTCKGYVAYLESLYKLENPIVDVLGIAKAKYVIMNKAIHAAQASIIGKVDKITSKKLRKSSAGLTKGFLLIQETIIKISATHDFKANAKLSFRESAKISKVVADFRLFLNVFMDIVYEVDEKKMKMTTVEEKMKMKTTEEKMKMKSAEKKMKMKTAEKKMKMKTAEKKMKMKTVAHQARKLGEERRGNAFERFFRKFAGKVGSYMGAKNQGRQLTEATNDDKLNAHSHAGVDIKGVGRSRFSQYFNGFLGGLHSRRELVEAHAGVQFNAAGKTKFVGKDGFRSLNRGHYKHII